MNIKVDQKADSVASLKAGGVNVYQMDNEREQEGQLEAHWHTARKEVVINGRTNVTRIKSFTDDGEIRKTSERDNSRKVRRLRAGGVKAFKKVQSVYSPLYKLPQHQPTDQEKKARAAKRKAQEDKEKKLLAYLIKKYVQTASISPIGQTDGTTTPAPAPSTPMPVRHHHHTSPAPL